MSRLINFHKIEFSAGIAKIYKKLVFFSYFIYECPGNNKSHKAATSHQPQSPTSHQTGSIQSQFTNQTASWPKPSREMAI